MVLLEQLKVRNYRSVKSEVFSLGSLAILIGKNNTGKSNVLRAINLLLEGTAKEVSEEDFFDQTKPIEIEAKISGVDALISTLGQTNQTKLEECLAADRSIWIRRVAKVDKGEVQFGKIEIRQRDNDTYGTPTGIDAALRAILPEVVHIQALDDPVDAALGRATKPMGKLLALIVGAIQTGAAESLEAAYSQVNKLLNVVKVEADGEVRETDERVNELRVTEQALNKYMAEGFPDASIRLKVNFPHVDELLPQTTVFIREGGVETQLSFKGHGLQRVFYLALLRTVAEQVRQSKSGATSKPYLLLFEEPELLLHPYAQQQMLTAVKTIATAIQVVVTTHSPFMVSPETIKGALLLTKRRDSETGKSATICLRGIGSSLDESSERELLTLLNLQRSSRFLFSDRVVLVEGVGDEHLLASMFFKLRGSRLEAHGVGVVEVGGKDKLPEYKTLLEALGLNVVALADLDFLWRGAGKVLQGVPEHSQFCEALKRDSQPVMENVVGEEQRDEQQKCVFTELARTKHRGPRDKLCSILEGKGYLVLKEGEIEAYVDLTKSSKSKYLAASREIEAGTRQIQYVAEIKAILECVCAA